MLPWQLQVAKEKQGSKGKIYIGFAKGDYAPREGRQGRFVTDDVSKYPQRSEYTGGWAGGEVGLKQFVEVRAEDVLFDLQRASLGHSLPGLKCSRAHCYSCAMHCIAVSLLPCPAGRKEFGRAPSGGQGENAGGTATGVPSVSLSGPGGLSCPTIAHVP
jgi:hypothetical protein